MGDLEVSSFQKRESRDLRVFSRVTHFLILMVIPDPPQLDPSLQVDELTDDRDLNIGDSPRGMAA